MLGYYHVIIFEVIHPIWPR